MKLNVDAAFHPSDLQGAIGAILRDDKGGFITVSNDRLLHVADAAMEKAYALRHGLLLAQ